MHFSTRKHVTGILNDTVGGKRRQTSVLREHRFKSSVQQIIDNPMSGKGKDEVSYRREAHHQRESLCQATIVQRILYSFLSIYLDRAEQEVDASAVMGNRNIEQHYLASVSIENTGFGSSDKRNKKIQFVALLPSSSSTLPNEP